MQGSFVLVGRVSFSDVTITVSASLQGISCSALIGALQATTSVAKSLGSLNKTMAYFTTPFAGTSYTDVKSFIIK